MRKGFLSLAAAAGLTVLCSFGAFAATVFQTVTTPADGCSLVVVEGSYNGSAQAALDRINEIRLEACREGIRDPRNESEFLTEEDYVPLKWSLSLEYIARVRAAESCLVVSHTRPNGKSCFTVQAPDNKQSYSEDLAWNWSDTIVSGVEQWYQEKYDWVNKTGEVTGHYTSMINPGYKYIGLASFTTKEGLYYNTVSAEFDGYYEHDTNMGAPAADCRVVIEIETSALSDTALVKKDEKIQKDGFLDKGDSVLYGLWMRSTLEGRSAHVYDGGNITWTSSDQAVATVDQNGLVLIKGAGSAVISAVSDSGRSASLTISTDHDFGDWQTVAAPTVFAEGVQERTCTICGETEKRPVSKLTPKLSLSKTTVKIRKTKSAKVKAAVAAGDVISAKSSDKKIAVVSVANGVVTIRAKKKAGTAYIAVTTRTGLSQKIKVTVPKVKTTSLSCKKKVYVKKGKKVTLKPKVRPAYCDDKITYRSANKKIASVSAKGVVKGVRKGTTIITIRSGKKTVKVKIIVK